jgi:UDP-galactopyranose mutase
MTAPLLIVFSQTRWDFVFRRPQHLLSRLASRWQVAYVEEPVRCSGPAWLEVRRRGPQLSVLVPHTPLGAPGFHDEQLPLLQGLLEDFLEGQRQSVAVAWLNTPMALPCARALQPHCIVYDCVADPAAQPGAPQLLRDREAALLDCATLVLTAGPSLYAAKRNGCARAYCLPNAVDATHFATSSLRPDDPQHLEAHRLQGDLPRPRLGYFGVIDERLDLSLLADLAAGHPAWTLVMAGPVVGIDASRLPKAPNLHWLGRQPYQRLPYLAAGWDLCLLPYVRNAFTRCFNPTQTLEYMAADKPVVSTAIHDVLWLYGDAVSVARAPADFAPICAALLAEPPAARSRRAIEMLSIVFMYSWDRSAHSVHKLLSRALVRALSKPTGKPTPVALDRVPA